MHERARTTRRWATFALALVATLAADAVADDTELRIAADEGAAIAALRRIAAAQTEFQASGVCDVDRDGIGEFGFLDELAGRAPVRVWWNSGDGGTVVLDPPLIPTSLGVLAEDEAARRAGYRFASFLPGSSGSAQGPHGFSLDSDLAETTWCCYAWPDRYAASGRRTFFVNQDGVVTANEQTRRAGVGAVSGQNAGSAIERGSGWWGSIAGAVAVGTVGRDGNVWQLAEERVGGHAVTLRGRLREVIGSPRFRTTFTLGSYAFRGRSRTRFQFVNVVEPDGDTDSRSAPWDVTLIGPTGTSSQYLHRYSFFPAGYDSETEWTDFAGGTIELSRHGVVLARGEIPARVLPGGPSVRGSSETFHATAPLGPAPSSADEYGAVEASLRITPHGRRERLSVAIYGARPNVGRLEVVAFDENAWNTLGTIAVAPEGSGRLVIDPRRTKVVGGLVALVGRTIEVRTQFGAALVRGTVPVLD